MLIFGDLSRQRSLLVFDSFESQKTEQAKRSLNSENTDFAAIHGGLTSVQQPLDVWLNKPFKDTLKQRWLTWMVEGIY